MRLFEAIENQPIFRKLAAAVASGGYPAGVFGSTPFVASLLAAVYARRQQTVVIALFANDGEASRAAEDLSRLGFDAEAFISRDIVLIDVESVSHEAEQARLLTLGRLLRGGCEVVCASADAGMQPVIPRRQLSEKAFSVKLGETLPIGTLTARLLAAGFVRVSEVEASGQFAVRGGIVDIFPCTSDTPVRLDYFGDTVEEMFRIDAATQRRSVSIAEVFLSPARETLIPPALADTIRKAAAGAPEKLKSIYLRDAELLQSGGEPPAGDRYMPFLWEKCETLFDFLPDAPVFVCSAAEVQERAKNGLLCGEQELSVLVEGGLLSRGHYRFFLPKPLPAERVSAYFEAFTRDVGARLSTVLSLRGCTELRWGGDSRQLREDARGYQEENYQVAVLAGTRRAARNMCDDLLREGLTAAVTTDVIVQPDCISVTHLSLNRGFLIPAFGICVISTTRHEQLSASSRSYRKSGRGIGSLSDISKGDYVVHASHGIGVYAGIKTIDFHGVVKDYITINYKGGDVLYVPVTQLDQVSQYVAPSEQKEPPIARLNSGEWQKTRQSVYRSARDMAKELIQLYARREKEQGVRFPEDDDWQRDFELRFAYSETDDQMRSIGEVKQDMERSRPMDRLLCGDVGVGKTEVAMRAAFKCVDGGYQCALLVPTTILAWQHYQSFLERFDGFPVRIAMLSRFSTPLQVKEAVKGIRDGSVDIAIGTHRLLQKDIQFKKLGLLIVDEEQRFGVAHKEKLKQAAAGVDVLTLSATPIPRTLSMALSGIRDMSVIEQAPQGRQPVQTYVVEYDDSLIGDAIRRELARGGQVYYLHNHVEDIESCAERLRRLAPDAHIEIAHGKMDEASLSRVWARLLGGECDILVCTTIIETGVDVPNCNTLIVENADAMGLSQLYQLRGRVGRSSRRAYAYFTFRRDKVLTEVATKRLSAIRDFTDFGSGYKIAMRDLQIRGAGNFLNASQSGHMHAVGYDMYIKILEDAINDEKGVARPAVPECLVDITVDAHLPESYISDPAVRIEMYKRVAAVNSEESAADAADEFRDRFGTLPDSVDDLIAVALIRTAAERLGFYEVKSRGDSVCLYCERLDADLIRRYTRTGLRPIRVEPKGRCCIIADLNGERATVVLRRLLAALEQLKSEAAAPPAQPPLKQR